MEQFKIHIFWLICCSNVVLSVLFFFNCYLCFCVVNVWYLIWFSFCQWTMLWNWMSTTLNSFTVKNEMLILYIVNEFRSERMWVSQWDVGQRSKKSWCFIADGAGYAHGNEWVWGEEEGSQCKCMCFGRMHVSLHAEVNLSVHVFVLGWQSSSIDWFNNAEGAPRGLLSQTKDIRLM